MRAKIKNEVTKLGYKCSVCGGWEKKIYEIHGKWIDSRHFQFKIKSIGGTYIKELASGDSGRTTPSLTGILGVGLKCVELDVLEISSH